MKSTKSIRFRNIILNLIFLVLLYIPHVDFLYIIPPILALYLIITEKPKLHVNSVAGLITVWIVLSYAINSLSTVIDSKTLVRSIMMIGVFLFFPFVKSFKIYKWTLLIAILYVLFSQMK